MLELWGVIGTVDIVVAACIIVFFIPYGVDIIFIVSGIVSPVISSYLLNSDGTECSDPGGGRILPDFTETMMRYLFSSCY